jgi:hypothetical protein
MMKPPQHVSTPPYLPASVDDLEGRLLHLQPSQWRYGHRPLTLRVTRIRVDISLWYDAQWCWVEGEEIAADGDVVRHIPVLVDVNALATESNATTTPRPEPVAWQDDDDRPWPPLPHT